MPCDKLVSIKESALHAQDMALVRLISASKGMVSTFPKADAEDELRLAISQSERAIAPWEVSAR